MMMETPTKPGPGSFSVLVGGKAGAGIDRSGTILGKLLNRLGYRIFIYRDYPSIIRGGHTFSIIRAEKDRSPPTGTRSISSWPWTGRPSFSISTG